GFTLVFGISVYNILKTGVNAIDKGQFEAAYALGHSYYSTFYRIILPLVIPLVMDTYKGEIIALIILIIRGVKIKLIPKRRKYHSLLKGVKQID
ncbi:MAG: ABC transporter permease subunit, partial [Lachnospiraceae bacterium]|nr:ABC transporter permease subunit [Lachnospiraceae bacterium]